MTSTGSVVGSPQQPILDTATSGGQNTDFSYKPGGDSRMNNTDLRGTNSTPHNYDIERFASRWAPRSGQVVRDQGGSVASQFPVQVQHGDPRDQRYSLLNNVIRDGVIPGFGQYMASSADLDYLATKARDAKNAQFKAWLYSQVDLKDPVYQKFWMEKLPALYTERMQLIEDQIDLHSRLAKINARGAQDIEDFMLLYLIDTGEIQVPTKPFFDPAAIPKKDFNRGMFNVNNWFTPVKNNTIGWKDPTKDWQAHTQGWTQPGFNNWGSFGR